MSIRRLCAGLYIMLDPHGHPVQGVFAVRRELAMLQAVEQIGMDEQAIIDAKYELVETEIWSLH